MGSKYPPLSNQAVGAVALRRRTRRSPIKGRPTRAKANPPGAGTAEGTKLVFTSVLDVAVKVVAVFTGTALIVSV
jgi:hypothetical protein